MALWAQLVPVRFEVEPAVVMRKSIDEMHGVEVFGAVDGFTCVRSVRVRGTGALQHIVDQFPGGHVEADDRRPAD